MASKMRNLLKCTSSSPSGGQTQSKVARTGAASDMTQATLPPPPSVKATKDRVGKLLPALNTRLRKLFRTILEVVFLLSVISFIFLKLGYAHAPAKGTTLSFMQKIVENDSMVMEKDSQLKEKDT
uniref:Uncharacterized protein n=1 Tax=Cannabis sativa TaxID=3483 RepID=A0A803PC44_CANSA